MAWHDDGFTSSSRLRKVGSRLATGTGIDSVSAMQCSSSTASPSSAAGDTAQDLRHQPQHEHLRLVCCHGLLLPPLAAPVQFFSRGLRRTLLKSGVLVGHRQVISNPFIQHTDGSP
ncbi:hypothetical protein GGP41_004743 [Bipolaris sorokiniana]|uniref:Uncharacterized protein n=1 Tax=Cochliobolus sativus TaxID=45130 RepID=A0A8H6DSD3_COCSA|nr:hypothetical protein GGP41_004743 [Bipolaris sorokiniana]